MDKYFYRKNDDGNAVVLHFEDGSEVTRIDANVYPVGSELSARYEHPEGIVLTVADAKKIGIQSENYQAAATPMQPVNTINEGVGTIVENKSNCCPRYYVAVKLDKPFFDKITDRFENIYTYNPRHINVF